MPLTSLNIKIQNQTKQPSAGCRPRPAGCAAAAPARRRAPATSGLAPCGGGGLGEIRQGKGPRVSVLLGCSLKKLATGLFVCVLEGASKRKHQNTVCLSGSFQIRTFETSKAKLYHIIMMVDLLF